MTPVELVVNVFERSYREVLVPGFFPTLAHQARRRFERRTVLVNNVEDAGDALARARALVDAGEVDAVHRVADRLDDALAATGLRREDLGRIPHYSDCALTAVTLPGPPYLVYWDADVTLETPCNWIDPSLALLGRDREVLVASPAWPGFAHRGDGAFAFDHGFSDQLFLVERARLARPVYRHRCLATLRYPMTHIAWIFEARVDAYMRCTGKRRAIYQEARYTHPVRTRALPPTTSAERWRRRRDRALRRLARWIPGDDPRWRE